MSVFANPSGTNTYVPDHDATGKMIVDFARNPKKFALNRYAQIVPVKKNVGFYLEMTVEEAGRILDSDATKHKWPDGADAPEETDTLEDFRYLPYRTQRRSFGFRLGDLAREQADWAIDDRSMKTQAQKGFTARTLIAVSKLTNPANYANTHTTDVSAIPGNTGNFAASTTARQDIKRAFNHAANVILDDTLDAVDMEDLIVVIGPGLAAAMAVSQEITDYIKGSPDAYRYVKGELMNENPNVKYGLPPVLYGFPLVIEGTRRTTNRKGGTKAVSRVFGNQYAAMVSRPGGLVGTVGPSFSTLTVYAKEEMTVETMKDTNNRRTKGRVVDDIAAVMTAPVSGYLFNNCM